MGAITSRLAPPDDSSDTMKPVLVPAIPRQLQPANARAGPGPSSLSHGRTKAVARVDEVEKEEGEISDEDDRMAPVALRQSSPRRRPSKASSTASFSSSRPSHSPQQAAFPHRASPRNSFQNASLPPKPTTYTASERPKPSPTRPRFASPQVEVKVEPGSARSTSVMNSRAFPGPISAAPAIITPQEARQYMDIIRNLLHDGFSPDDLVLRGATAKYVTAVCAEIVAAAKKRPSFESWEQSGSEQLTADPTRTRRTSHGSETSDERAVERLMEPSSPKNSSKLVASSSWQPVEQPAVPLPSVKLKPPAAPSAVKIESYRPASASRAPPTGPSSMSAVNTPTTNLTVSMKNFHPMSSYSGTSSTAPQLPRLPVRPPQKAPHSSAALSITSTVPPAPTSVPPPLPPPPLSVAGPSSSRNLGAEIAARTALLETRRKAFESMKRRREKNRPATTPAEAPPDNEGEVPEKSIEEQMADLEKEVMTLHTAAPAADIDMDIETEDGEIADLPTEAPSAAATPPTLPAALAPAASVPIRIPRGIKRANAEDMMDTRPTSLPARLPPNKRRSLFGGIPQRPQRLVLHVDHSDSASDDEDEPRAVIPSGTSTPIILPAPLSDDNARLLAEKEVNIRKLREQIERRMRARLEKKEDSAAPSPASEMQVEETTNDGPKTTGLAVNVEDVEMDEPAVIKDNEEITKEASPSPPPTQQTSYFRPYTLLLTRYPRLSRLPPRSTRADYLEDIDQSLLAYIILTRRLQSEPEAVLCGAEAAGGSCADAGCGDIHLSRSIPEDADLAEYLALRFSAKPTAAILAAISNARLTASVPRRDRGKQNKPAEEASQLGPLLARAGALLSD